MKETGDCTGCSGLESGAARVFRFEVDPGDAIKELDEANNTDQTRTVTAELGAASIGVEPVANSALVAHPFLSGAGNPHKVQYKVVNYGHVTWATETSVPIQMSFEALPAGEVPDPTAEVTGDQWELDTTPLAPGKGRVLTGNFNFNMNHVEGPHHIWIRIEYLATDGEQAVAYFRATDTPVDLLNGYIDLAPSIPGNARVPAVTTSGNGSTINLPVNITNRGTLPTGKDTIVKVRLTLRDGEGPDQLITEDPVDLAIGAIPAGATRRFAVPVQLRAGMGPLGDEPGEYVIGVELVETDELEELVDQRDDNDAVSPPLMVVRGDADLTPLLPEGLDLPAAIGGSGQTFNLPVTVKNVGNLPLPGRCRRWRNAPSLVQAQGKWGLLRPRPTPGSGLPNPL